MVQAACCVANATAAMCVMRAQTNVISATVCLAVGALVRNLSLANLVASLALLYALLLCGCVRECIHRCTAVGRYASTRAVGVVKKQPRGRELAGVGRAWHVGF